jgi:hypothetical protein
MSLMKRVAKKLAPYSLHTLMPMLAAAVAILLITSGCTRESLSSAIYSCNIEFRGRSEEAIGRVEACRRGASIAHETTVEMASEVAKLVAVLEDAALIKTQIISDIDFDESGARVQDADPQESALSEIGTEVVHRAQSRCKTVFRRTADGRLACMAGIRNFRARDFEKILLSSVDVGELKKRLDSVGIPLGASAVPASKGGGGH